MVCHWDAATGRLLGQLERRAFQRTPVALTRDLKTLVMLPDYKPLELIDVQTGKLVDRPSNVPSERMYHKLLHDLGLGESAQWAYYKLWPNAAIEVYPDQVDFMQFVPASPTETTLRYINYGLPDGRREMKALRYLNWRINRLVNLEDKDLIERVQAGMASSSFTTGPLGEGEVCLRSFARRMRALFPEMREGRPPPKGWSTNRKAPRPQ